MPVFRVVDERRWHEVQIPTHSGQVFRFDAGRDSDLMPATVPN
jgi:hypothetical protein